MCGICGIYNLNGSKVNSKELVRMRDVLRHRGPDDKGSFIHKNIGLGHRRLAIIDLSKAGANPMCNEAKTIWITFNGEIYNFKELRADLIKKGHKFKTKTDTEVIIHLYEEEGENVVKRLRGMFAFAIYDIPNDTLMIARDRIGQKPVIYAKIGRKFVFASEPKSILTLKDYKKEIDLEALHHYLAYSFSYVPYPYTLFKGIKKLEPASYILIKNNKIKIKKYWTMDLKEDIKTSKRIATNKYRDLLREAVQLRQMSDVPLGVLLSGGLDSSSITAMMDSKNQIKSYAFGYDKKDSEFQRAKIVANQFKTKHTEVLFKGLDLTHLPNLIKSTDEPVAFMAYFYAYVLLQQMSKQNITVVLSGDCGDELFAGYDSYNTQLLLMSKLFKYDKLLPKKPIRMLEKFLIKFNQKANRRVIQNLISGLHLINTPTDQRISEVIRVESKKITKKLYSSMLKKETKHIDVGALVEQVCSDLNTSDYTKKLLHFTLLMGNSYANFVGDMAGMPHSLEVRAPLLDHHMVEFANKLPMNLKIPSIINKRKNKFIMRKAMEGILPRDIIYKKKMGFGYNVPWDQLLRTDWSSLAEEILFNRSLKKTGLFNMKYIRQTFDDYVAGRGGDAYFIWKLIMFEIWYEMYIEDKTGIDIQHMIKDIMHKR